MSMIEMLARAKADNDPGRLVEAIPYARWLGMEFKAEGANLAAKLRFHEDLVGNASVPALHGGTVGALLESTAIFEVLWRMETAVLPKTITFTVDYLRPAKLQDVHARATVTRQGRRVANVRAEAWQEDPARPVATANAIFLVLPSEPK